MAKKKTDKYPPVGKTIKKVRTEKKIDLTRVANDTGCSVDYLKSIESGKEIPPVGTLLQIARALKIDSGSLLKDQQDTHKARIRAYTERTKNYAYTTLTPGAENKHLKAFKIQIEARQDHQGVGYLHEGEEFIYTLKGEIEVTVGDHINHLGQGESLHFNSGIRHHLKNIGEQTAELLVVVYNP